MNWSDEQHAIFAFIENDDRSLMVRAGAGAGKTTTGLESMRRLDPMSSRMFLAFNKRIQENLANKLNPSNPKKAPAKTFHALGNLAWKLQIDSWAKVDGYKVSGLVRRMSDNSNPEFRSDVAKLVSFAKGVGIVPANVGFDATGLVMDSVENWIDLADEYDLDFGRVDKHRAVELARAVLSESIEQREETIDFDDMLYLPIVFGAKFVRYDYLFVDEAQDVNEIQREVIRRSLEPDGRLIAIGDEKQSIYGFRGAGTNSMALLKHEFNAEELPLSVSYRCPIKIVQDANQQVPWLKYRDGAPEGRIERIYSYDPKDYLPSDVILCRFNAPLVEQAFKLIARDVPCRVLGRDIGSGLIALVKKMHAENIPDLENRLMRHLASERSRLIRDEKYYKINSLQDRIDTLFIFTKQMPTASIADLQTRILNLFDDEVNPNRLTLSTIHKAKGLEWNRVFILKYGLIGKYSVDGVADQEDNLRYVAKTRSMNELVYIEE
jgi:DNA helicase II / ATP-dependent DNA helicase PcrA